MEPRTQPSAAAPLSGHAPLTRAWPLKLLPLPRRSPSPIHVQLEQLLGLRLGAMKQIPYCTCTQGSRRTNLLDLANAHHALGCVKCNACQTQRAPQHWNRISLKLQRCDVRISTLEDDGKGLVVDYSTTCPTLPAETLSRHSTYPFTPPPANGRRKSSLRTDRPATAAGVSSRTWSKPPAVSAKLQTPSSSLSRNMPPA